MKAGFYWRYATRSLLRGGQRTLLAIFCVAVGVMAIVSLQLVGNMVNNGLTANVREGNGGDISVRSDVVPISAQQLKSFDTLLSDGTITDYTAVASQMVQGNDKDGTTDYFTLRAVDPQKFPLAGAPAFKDPSDGSFSSLLTGDSAVVTQKWLDQTGYHKGDSVSMRTTDGRSLHVTIDGVLFDAGAFQRPQILVSLDTFAAAPSSSGLPVSYSVVYVMVPGHTDANAATAKKAIETNLPQATVTTTKDALANNENNVQSIRNFLRIVGLLALLIGGIGIVNTMQVLLRRRQLEIAMLKTAGYRRGNLYVMFGLEAGVLGVLGGALGAAIGVGVSFLVKGLVERAFFINLPASIDPFTVASGVAIGFFTALIFGLMPIVQASEIRPLAVLRGLAEGSRVGSVLLTIGLSVLLVGMFFALSLVVLGDLGLTVLAVVITGALLVLLSLFFTLVVLVISKLPVPDGFPWWYVLIVVAGLLVAAGITWLAPGFGVLLLIVAAFGFVLVLLPRTWKSNVKMAIRNIGRQRARTVTTLIALFIGVFAIGIILVLGQNIKDQINQALLTNSRYNSFVLAGATNRAQVEQTLKGVSGIQAQQENSIAQGLPISVNGVPMATVVKDAGRGGPNNIGKEGAYAFLSGVQGFDLSQGALPQTTIVAGHLDHGAKGRNLTPADAGTSNVIMPQSASLAPLNLKLNDTFVVADQLGKTTVTFTVVGFYSDLDSSFGTVWTDSSQAFTLSGGKPLYLFQLKFDPTQADQKLHEIQKAVPDVQTFSFVELLLLINTLLNNLIIMLTAIASLAMIAGIIIIANAVALAMLERRRELGILKSVGFTSRSVLGEVLLENGMVGFTGALLAMLLVTLATTILSKAVFNSPFGVATPLVLGIVLATAAVCMAVAGFVAWGATRVRPLEVLRYE
ncbi:MAG TPA: FtsX-like permease family protein [Ktedonobacterales bacterium]|nr:FtsX-like permease family protein [Ktedonobacterales bacterium]